MYLPIRRVHLKNNKKHQQSTNQMMLMRYVCVCVCVCVFLIFFISEYVVGTHLNCILRCIDVGAIQMDLCYVFTKEVDKKYTGCNPQTTESLNCALIGVFAVIRSNTIDILKFLKTIMKHRYEGSTTKFKSAKENH